jgi:hypothetical protein
MSIHPINACPQSVLNVSIDTADQTLHLFNYLAICLVRFIHKHVDLARRVPFLIINQSIGATILTRFSLYENQYSASPHVAILMGLLLISLILKYFTQ